MTPGVKPFNFRLEHCHPRASFRRCLGTFANCREVSRRPLDQRGALRAPTRGVPSADDNERGASSTDAKKLRSTGARRRGPTEAREANDDASGSVDEARNGRLQRESWEAHATVCSRGQRAECGASPEPAGRSLLAQRREEALDDEEESVSG
ncbi:hypothetical protein MRX96_054355 [Rhipicephalus microplus]